ncbi:O-antigen ligase family protein [Alkalibacter mobilis]|uniref:O-antigen ligase family protein n=1 Tax=Alkalibacter mobilis TaxID=2787712 RepID=UPI00189EDEB2|nr:hypothetical protein [Alkalibacter mobilis]MBF7097337.1 hypothetical protein [Alkalibacter mobilis]
MNGTIKSQKEKNKIILFGSLINITLLSIGHAWGSTALVLGSIGLFLIIVLASPGEYFLPLMIFYLPWSSLLRTYPGSSSFHSIVLLIFLVVMIVKWLKNNGDLRKSYLALSIMFITFTLGVKFFNRLSINPQYIFFISMILFVPIYLEEYKWKLKFDTGILFLTMGNISACIASTVFIDNPGIHQFMDLNQEMIVGLRYSAFYSDPNYFSAQMLVAITGLLIIATKTKRKRTVLGSIILIGVLLYFAMQAVSKAFLISGTLVFSLWIINLLLGKRPFLYKFYIILVIGTVAFIILKNNIFEEQINYYLLRFGKANDAVSLTTGRLVLWQVYLGYLLENIDKLAFGIGLSQDQLQIQLNTNNAHMTVIQILYQVGVFGFALLLMWWKSLFNGFMEKSHVGFTDWGNMVIMTTAIIMPWFGLDVLYFREFFYFPLLLLLLKGYLWENSRDAGDSAYESFEWIGKGQKNQA